MIRYTQGNLLEADTQAVVNTVNTVGVMGKGIALMFKEAFRGNFEAYADACKKNNVQVGCMFVTENDELTGPRWIINFPTKKHWRHPTKIEWIEEGLADLKNTIIDKKIQSVAIPPLGCGNGGLEWFKVRSLIEAELSDLKNVEIITYEPTSKYQNVAKRKGETKLTPARALIAELVRQYCILGIECTLLEIQKLAWFLEQSINSFELDDPLDLRFVADKYGPYADRLRHLLNALDGSYLCCNKHLNDAGPLDTIWFNEEKKDIVSAYLNSEGKKYIPALNSTTKIIDGFESPLGMELLATVDWLLRKMNCNATIDAIKNGIKSWPGGKNAAQRKIRLFDDRLIKLALEQLT